jgi:DNA-binding MarR family transcriptional regulator
MADLTVAVDICMMQILGMGTTAKASGRQTDASYVARIQHLVYQLARLMERCDELCLARHDITVSQGYTLMSLPPSGDLTMNALSETIGVAGSTATRMVDQLVKKGLADRQHDPEDRRMVRVALTKRGQALRKELEAAMESCFTDAFAEVAESERPATVRVLELVTGSLAKALEANGCTSCRVR